MATKKQDPKRITKVNIGTKQKSAIPDFRTQIIVQLKDHIQLPITKDITRYIKEFNIGPWEQLVKKHPGLTAEPLFSNINPKTLLTWIQKAKEMDVNYKGGNFFQYLKITCPIESNTHDILNDLTKWSHINHAYVKIRNPNPAVTYTNDPYANTPDPYQSYLNNAPEGIGAKAVWDTSITGSDGIGIKFIDIETGWTLNHEDLSAHSATCLFGTPEDTGRDHGTGVLGIVCANDNTTGCVGIVPNLSKVDVIAQNPSGVAAGILESLKYLTFGDVLLVEATNIFNYPETGGVLCTVPVETTGPEFDAIRLATALGIIVIEPGGNGDNASNAVDFDNFTIGSKEVLNSGSIDFKDSGAIIVTAGQSALSTEVGFENTHLIMPWAPKGNRIDCFAWGENITTLSSDIAGTVNQYTSNFGGTSGAAAIITGAVINMQAMVLAEHGYRFSPSQIREILRDTSYGTSLSKPTGALPFLPQVEFVPIYMPDLQKFINHHLNYPPDLYLRDFIGDTGLPHAGAISLSPDIILKNISESNPQTAFGQGSGTENDANLSDTAIIGQTNFLYFRALNQGGSLPNNSKVTLFYSVPSTLLTPSLLNYVGQIGFSTAIPTGEVLTVSNELQWVALGPQGHYCFVAVISCDEDPSLDPRNIPNWDWTYYQRYIRENNNVTWRNFNMVPMPPPSPAPGQAPEPDPEQEPAPGQEPVEKLPKNGWIALDFISPGLPDRDARMQIAIKSKLPKGSKILLQMPLSWKKNNFNGSPYIWTNKKKKLGFVNITSTGFYRINKLLLRAQSKTPLKLFIYIPEKLRTRKYQVSAIQIMDNEELGRVTWELIPDSKKPIKR